MQNSTSSTPNFLSVCEKRISDKTIKDYNLQVKRLFKWLGKNYSEDFSISVDETLNNSSTGSEEDTNMWRQKLPLITNKMLEDWMFHESVHEKGKNKGMLKCRSNNEKNRSAVLWLYKKLDATPPANFHSTSKDFVQGRVKQIVSERMEGKMDSTQGKDVLTQVGYISLCVFAFASTSNQSAHLFLTLAWNLMTRSCNTAELRINHFSWGGDCIKVGWGGKQKSNQTGEKGSTFFESQIRHVYANPTNPYTCCFLALGIWVLSSVSMEKNSPLFSAESEESNFNYWLRKTVEDLTEEDSMAYGYNFQRLSSHSTRKGSTSYAASLPGLCNIIALWLRAGWSLGTVLPSYAHANDGGDQNVGRILSGLDPNSPDLSMLPARFNREDVEDIPWTDLLVNFELYPADFKIVVPYLVASVVYHKDFIIEHLPRQNKLFLSRFWISGWQMRLQNKVIPPVRMKCDVTGMVASGVGPVTLLQNDFQKTRDELFDVIQGAQPVTRRDVADILQSLADLRREISQQGATTRDNTSYSSSVTVQPHPSNGAISNNTSYDTWYWGNEFGRPTPENYTFPTKNTTLRNIHDLWHFGCVYYDGTASKNIRPYKHITAEHFSGGVKAVRKNRSRAKGTVDAIDECINNISTTNYANLPLHERDAVWKTAMQQLTEKFEGELAQRKRKASLQDMEYCSVYENYLLPSKKRGQQQEQQQSQPPVEAEP